MAGLIRSVGVADGFQTIMQYPVLSTSTFLKGDFLTMDSNGRLQQLLTAASNFGSGALIVGQAQANALDDNGNVRPYVPVILAQPETRFWLPIYNATPASAIFTPGDMGVAYELTYVSSTAGFALDNGHTTNTCVKYLSVSADDYPGWPTYNSAGTVQNPLVLVQILTASCKFGGS